ncbi:hypothetical protein HMPREF0682_0768, partial [Propionibacterium acidifaciens F0233]
MVAPFARREPARGITARRHARPPRAAGPGEIMQAAAEGADRP